VREKGMQQSYRKMKIAVFNLSSEIMSARRKLRKMFKILKE
jgi:hypothetical protein